MKDLYFNNVEMRSALKVPRVTGNPTLVEKTVWGAVYRDLHDDSGEVQVIGSPVTVTIPSGLNQTISHILNPSMKLTMVGGAAYYLSNPAIQTGASYSYGDVSNINVVGNVGVAGTLQAALSDHIAHVSPRQAEEKESFWQIPVLNDANEPTVRELRWRDWPSGYSDEPPSFCASYPAQLAANPAA